MTRYLAGVLSVIAVGIVLIAYGLLSPQASAFSSYQGPNNGLVTFGPDGNAPQPVIVTPQGTYVLQQPAYPVQRYSPATYGVPQQSYVQQTAAPVPANIVRVADDARVVTRSVVREPKRNWGKTAMVIGGSSAAGAGIGGIVGGKKGALIGAAIGGGASTLFESTRKN